MERCCNDMDGMYRYCMLTTVLDWTSQRHTMNCPADCHKCDEFHQDINEYTMKVMDVNLTKEDKKEAIEQAIKKLVKEGWIE